MRVYGDVKISLTADTPRCKAAVAFAALSLLGGPAALHSQEEATPPSYYAVESYDPARDPFADLEMAVERAREEGKRILLEVGGQWCGWCRILDLYIRDHPAVSSRLESWFLVVKVNWSPENRNEAFLGRYPAIGGYPHLFVLDSEGTLLSSESTGQFEEGRSYRENALVAFLEKWKPPLR